MSEMDHVHSLDKVNQERKRLKADPANDGRAQRGDGSWNVMLEASDANDLTTIN